MIELTKLNDVKFLMNPDLIEVVEAKPDTTITLRNGKMYIVKEPPQTVADKVLAYRRSQFGELLCTFAPDGKVPGITFKPKEEDF